MFKRILLKLSGEALQGNQGFGIDPKIIQKMAIEVKNVHEMGIEIALVIGGGNIFRGLMASAQGMERTAADYMGMLATVLNSLALQDALEKLGVSTRIQSALNMSELCEPYVRRRAIRHLEKKRVIVLAGGIGSPYFTTDTTAALRAMEVRADAIFKATKVNGVYDQDPVKFLQAKMFNKLSYKEVLDRNLKVMDSTAISLCMENKMPIYVFNMNDSGNIKRILSGEKIGTVVRE